MTWRNGGRNEVGIALKKQLIKNVNEVKTVSDKLVKIKIEVEGEKANIVRA